ncbi:chemotaxis protein CheW [Halovulum dunhuangense]|uniref:Chemotaxis protein CheW n=2 Tax=Halovulum dunhuangense TaxID=1505036 RepID=A0A849L1E4_9RHOB|nr:chemotaxis protein CheW [Halovulum dunhuangense]
MSALTLELGGEIFAIEASRVREVLDCVTVTEVPNAPPFVGGLLNVRGRVVPLADLRVKFAMKQTPPDENTRIVVLEIDLDGAPMIVGVVADRVHKVADIDLSDMEEAPRVGMRWRPEFLRGVARHEGQFIIVPDLERIVSETPSQDAAQALKQLV